jgi:hypothetical protein
MYSIRIRVNHLKKVLIHGTKESVPIHLDNGFEPYRFWRGFTLEEKQSVKLVVEAFAGGLQDPRDHAERFPDWIELEPGEYLAGSYDNGFVYAVLPFRVVT